MRVLIIGGGPAGIVTLKTLLHFPRAEGAPAPFDPIVVELAPAIGGTFAWRSYENSALVSSKQLTAFSDFRFPRAEDDHPTLPRYVQYLEDYVRKFDLDAPAGSEWSGTEGEGTRIRLGCRVVKMRRAIGGGHTVSFAETQRDGSVVVRTVHADAVAICSGLHVTPAIPEIEGLTTLLVPQDPPILAPLLASSPVGVTGLASDGVRLIHSSQYKKREEFTGRNVLILGCGETSMDLSYEAIQAGAKEVVLCHRGGFLSFPKVLNDFTIFGALKAEGSLPIDGLITNLFETSYVHRWVAASHIRWFVSDAVIKRVLWFLTGTQAGCAQFIGGLPPDRLGRAYVFLNKSSKAMPYINRPYKPKFRVMANVFGTYYDDPPEFANSSPEAVIDLALWPSHVDKTGRVHFLPASAIPQSSGMVRPEEARMEKREVRPDLVVYCTGYKSEFPFLDETYPKPNVRSLIHDSDPSVAYLGFVRPGVGAIPPLAELQSMLWSLLLIKQVPIPTSPPHYQLIVSKTARIQHGVDHSAYSAQLANDCGASPSLLALYRERGLHVLAAFCLGASFVPFYRLTGPFASGAEMDSTIKGEIWETITRRGLLGNIFMGIIPMIFYGLLNLTALVAETIWLMVIRPVMLVFGATFDGPVEGKGKMME